LPKLVAFAEEAHPGQRVEVFFEDEARFGQQGTLTSVWALRGSRPVAPKQVGYANVQVLTAVCPQTGQAEGLIAERLNATVIQLFLEQLSATIPEGVHAILVWDGAGWHTAKALRPPANLTLVTLPPYSPELNPVERLWHYLREHHWSNREYRSVQELEDAAIAGWRAVCLRGELIRTVCRCEYLPEALS
jgi:transposase